MPGNLFSEPMIVLLQRRMIRASDGQSFMPIGQFALQRAEPPLRVLRERLRRRQLAGERPTRLDHGTHHEDPRHDNRREYKKGNGDQDNSWVHQCSNREERGGLGPELHRPHITERGKR
jgi:hypothetical protein